ncbi:arabinosyltransferase domain-containing protein [Rhodococcus sp. Q]|uniref:arabinosyltransferase domain-containing protein n=1 Tax=Rhodococcus sp. Q TaxID=2502252 RepID=UPI0010F86C38|nr:arabinosyltransferase domain-containing protein [Rhodococcus sp. Q]
MKTAAGPPTPTPSHTGEPPSARRDLARVRLIAVISAVIGILAATAIPFLPVTHTEARISWPQNGSLDGITAPLVSYTPTDLEISIPCAAIGELAAAGGGTLVSTAPIGAAQPDRWALSARTLVDGGADARLEVVARNTVLLSTPVAAMSGADCAVAIASSSDRTVVAVTDSDGDTNRVFDGDLRPQLVGVFSDLGGVAPDGLRVDATLDTRFTTSPTAVKLIAMVMAALATAGALWALYRLDAVDGRRTRRFLPASWWSFTRIDAVVVGVLVSWHVIGANTSDDGYQLGMARAAGDAGYMANYFRWFGVPEAPFGTPFYDVLAWMTHVSTASVWMRLPALLAGVLAWWLLSREVAPRLGAAARRSTLPLWTGALVFLAFWLPFNNGLRPEPIVAVGVLLTWCSVERAIATRRLLPAAAAILIGAVTVTAGPSGIICFAALISGARPIARIVADRAKAVGHVALLLPMLSAGLVVLVAVFADQTFAAVREMQRVHAIPPSEPWFNEYLRYQWLFQDSTDGSLARRFAVFTMVLCLLTLVVALLRRGRIPGTAVGPTRRIAGITIGAMVLMTFVPTKWTHHFGIYAGLAGAVAIAASIAVAPAVLRSRRNRALFAAVVMCVVAISFAGRNDWWYVSAYGVPWFDKAPSIAGHGFAVAFLAVAVLLFGAAAWFHIHPTASTRTDAPSRLWVIPPLTVAAAVMVAFEVLSLAKGAVSQYPAYSVARSNIDALTGSTCGLANDVLLETDPNASMLRPLSGNVGAGVAAGGGDGFTPNGVARNLTPDAEDVASGTANTVDRTGADQNTTGSTAGTGGGFGGEGVNGSTVALPFGLDPATTPVLGSDGAAGVATVTTDWYLLPDPDGSGSRGDLVSISAAGSIRSVDADGIETYGQDLVLEYGARGADGSVSALGSTVPLDIGPTPSWRNLRVPLDGLPGEADVVRVVATDHDVRPEQWLAFTPPRVPQTRTLQDVLGRDTPVLLDWAVGLNFPCQHQMLHANGVAEVPEYRISPDRPLAVVTGLWQDHYGGGPLGWTQLLLGARTIPSYLAHDWDRDWGSLEQFVPIDRTAGPAQIRTGTVTRSGLWTPGPINVTS